MEYTVYTEVERVAHQSVWSAVWSPAPPVHISKCPWAIHLTPNCSRRLRHESESVFGLDLKLMIVVWLTANISRLQCIMTIGWPQQLRQLTRWVKSLHCTDVSTVCQKCEPQTAESLSLICFSLVEEGCVCHGHLIDLIEGNKWFTVYEIIGGDVSLSSHKFLLCHSRFFFFGLVVLFLAPKATFFCCQLQ